MVFSSTAAQPQHWHKLPAETQLGSNALVLALLVLVSEVGFCPKLWKSAILPESHTGNPLPVNHSEHV